MLEDIIKDAKTNESSIKEVFFDNETITDIDISKINFEQVRFIKCRFMACDFTQVNFINVNFENCDISNCIFAHSYWKSTNMINCKAVGSDFRQSYFKEAQLEGSLFQYANCVKTTWMNCVLCDCDFKEAFMSEAKFKVIKLHNVNLSRVDFFKTPLKGIDLSDCSIEGILLSETYKELHGAKINMFQAAGIAQLLGVQIV